MKARRTFSASGGCALVGADAGNETEEQSMKKRIVLIAGMGTTPAVLTETVWALAHQSPVVVPDDVVVLVTQSGKEKLYEEILAGSPSIWAQLCASLRDEGIDLSDKLVFGETSIRLIPDARGEGVVDLRTGEDNLRAADFMLSQLRQYTESPDTVVLTSIAGGRKTMSALLFSCMTLLGRADDKVLHVLLPPEFEGGVEPAMYYPVQGVTYTNRLTGKKYRGEASQCELFEVPFVRMRGWYQEKFKTIPPSYRTLIAKVQMTVPLAVAYPEIEIDAWNGWVSVDGHRVPMSRPCFAVLLLLVSGVGARDFHRRLLAAHGAKGVSRCSWLVAFQESPLFRSASDPEDVYKTLSNLRARLKKAGVEDVLALVPKRGNPVTFPLSQIKWRNRTRFADVCGCLISTKGGTDGL